MYFCISCFNNNFKLFNNTKKIQYEEGRYTYFSIDVCAIHVFVVYIKVCNKKCKTLKYRRNDLCVFVFIYLIYFNIGYEISIISKMI